MKHTTTQKRRLIAFASGSGSTADYLLKDSGNTEIVLLVCDKPGAKVLDKFDVPKVEYTQAIKDSLAQQKFLKPFSQLEPRQKWLVKQMWYKYYVSPAIDTIVNGDEIKPIIHALGYIGLIPRQILKKTPISINNHPAPVGIDFDTVTAGKHMHGIKPYESGLKFFDEKELDSAVWQFTIHNMDVEFDSGAPIVSYKFPIKTDASPKKLQLLTMLIEKHLTRCYYDQLAYFSGEDSDFVPVFPELSQVIQEISGLIDHGLLEYEGNFEELIRDVLTEDYSESQQSELKIELERISLISREYKRELLECEQGMRISLA